MQVCFWGTRGSIATPAGAMSHFGGNTSCVQVTTAAGTELLLDCGTGAYPLANALLAPGPKPLALTILLGHTHWDHIQGFPFFGPAFVQGNAIAIYGPTGGSGSLHDVLAGQMEFTYFPVELDQLPARITFMDLAEGTHTMGECQVKAQFLNHPAMTLGYRIEVDGVALVYLVDHEPFAGELWRADAEPGLLGSILHEGDRRHAEFMAGADLVIHDGQYTPEEYVHKKGWGHSPFDYVVQVAAAAGVRRLALTHHDPSHNDAAVADIQRRARELASSLGSDLEVFCAFEGYHLPIAPRLGVEAVAPDPPPPTMAAERHFRVLVIDDDPESLELVVSALANEQHTVTTATSGADGLRQVAAGLPDMVVVACQMRGIDGLEFTRTVRASPQWQTLPILMLTALADEPSTRAGFEAGVTDYLTKPFSPPQLMARVQACLVRGQLR